MKKIKRYLKPEFFTVVLLVSLLILPLEFFAGSSASFKNAQIQTGKVDEPTQTNTPPKHKRKKRVKSIPKKMDTKLLAVPAGKWGAQGIILNVEEKGVTIEYECADGQIEQSLKMDVQGNFTVNGVHTRQRPGPIRADASQTRQPARYEGKILGDKMTLKVILTATQEVIGEFTLERGKTPLMTRCY